MVSLGISHIIYIYIYDRSVVVLNLALVPRAVVDEPDVALSVQNCSLLLHCK
jgi:hypothetical protein